MDYAYEAPILTVDAVIFMINDGELKVLTTKRSKEPFIGELALPGGYNAKGNTTLEVLERVVNTKAGLRIESFASIDQLTASDSIARDPRGHSVSISYLVTGYNLLPNVTPEKPKFYPATPAPKLAFDHNNIVSYAIEELRIKCSYTTFIKNFLPDKFTFSDLQKAYEAIYSKKFDKRNFKKKILGANMILETREVYAGGAHRPAKLYKFKSEKVARLEQIFNI